MRTTRLILALSTIALVAAFLTPAASANRDLLCTPNGTLSPEVCAAHPCNTFEALCDDLGDELRRCLEGPVTDVGCE